MVIRDINRRVSGAQSAQVSRGALDLGQSLVGGRILRHGISVGCGNGSKEIALIAAGVVQSMVCYDLAVDRIAAANATAAQRGLGDRITFHVADAFDIFKKPTFDFVYWNNALHHMFDVPGALAWSRDVLEPGGLLLVDEYVGASRMRFEDETLAYASALRHIFPERLLVKDAAGNLFERSLDRNWFESRIAKDPSEAVDAGRTLSAIADLFPGCDIRPTGGVVYFIALNGLFGNFDMNDPQDRRMLEHLLKLDEIYTAARPEQTLYAVAAAIR